MFLYILFTYNKFKVLPAQSVRLAHVHYCIKHRGGGRVAPMYVCMCLKLLQQILENILEELDIVKISVKHRDISEARSQ